VAPLSHVLPCTATVIESIGCSRSALNGMEWGMSARRSEHGAYNDRRDEGRSHPSDDHSNT
jgi:hypothetical protein